MKKMRHILFSLSQKSKSKENIFDFYNSIGKNKIQKFSKNNIADFHIST